MAKYVMFVDLSTLSVEVEAKTEEEAISKVYAEVRDNWKRWSEEVEIVNADVDIII